MAQQVITFGTDDKGTNGDSAYSAFVKCNFNFEELYKNIAGLTKSGVDKLTTTRTISMTGDGTWSASFDGSGNVSAVLTLANTGVIAGGYGSNTEIPTFSVDAKGRITTVSKIAIRAATTNVSGLVQLSSATNSTSAALAATPAAIKIVYDLAAAAIPNTQKGVASGVASLDALGKIPSAQLPINNTLTSQSVTEVLSAAQGKVLSEKIEQKLSASAITAPGTAPIAGCRAWVNFNGQNTVAINASMNVSSVTDRGVGLFTINFITPMPHANYASSALAQRSGNYGDIMISMMHSNGVSQSTAALPILVCDSGASLQDPIVCTVSTFA